VVESIGLKVFYQAALEIFNFFVILEIKVSAAALYNWSIQ